MVYDIAIIGGGPAGISAAINAKVLNKNFVWFASGGGSDKVVRAELVKNYPGLPDITGAELAKTFKTHVENMQITPNAQVVTAVYETGETFTLLAGNNDFAAKSVILCTGVYSQKLIAGEEKFLGRGVSYCATCDGMMFKGKKIAVYCTDKSFAHEVEFLSSVAEKVYFMPMYRNPEIKGDNIEIIIKQPVEIAGNMRVESVAFKDGKIDVDGIFILRNSVAPSALLHGLEVEDGHITVNRRCETNIKGVFAAGDCTGRPYQYIKAAGEGNIAVHSAVEYLSGK